jgi:diamine N-acetyltransferase
MIQLEKISYENLDAVIDIYDTLVEQDKHHVAPNIYSLAEAYVSYETAWPRAIVLNKEVIGFIMLSLDYDQSDKDDHPVYYLWRFMIATKHQNKGYGKQVLDMIVDKCKQDNIHYLYLSCTLNDPMPYSMYIKYGFIDTKREVDGEQLLKLKIAS